MGYTAIHEVEWHAHVASGIYFYCMNAVSVSDPHDRFMQAKKMLLLKVNSSPSNAQGRFIQFQLSSRRYS
jgi:hypothetical protein